jgi:hypothetical protein
MENGRANKINLLKKIKSGDLKAIDLITGDDGFFIKVGKCYLRDGIRYSERQFRQLQESFERKGLSIQLMVFSPSDEVKKFIHTNTFKACT